MALSNFKTKEFVQKNDETCTGKMELVQRTEDGKKVTLQLDVEIDLKAMIEQVKENAEREKAAA